MNVGGTWFHKTCKNEAETYEAVSAIMERNKIMFPDRSESKSFYMGLILETFKTGHYFSHALPELFTVNTIDG